MKWLLAAGLVSFGALAPAAAQDLSVTGSVDAAWSSAQLISPSSDAIVRPGHTLSITVTAGQVDINQDARSRRKCSLFGLDCHWVNWTDHHWSGTDKAPVLVQVRAVSSKDVVASAVVGPSGAVIPVPSNGSDFPQRYEVAAILAGVGSTVDPNRSAGAYTVRLDVNASGRAGALSGWMDAANPDADAATSGDVLDQALVAGHGPDVAAALRAYASRRFPLTQQALRSSHEKLLRKAMEVAPSDPANAIALAAYFRVAGLNTDADNLLDKAINELQGKTDPESRRSLGQAYAARADVTLSLGGGVAPRAVQEAIAYLEKAIETFGDSARRDLLADALTRRGRLLRGLRTEDALHEAAASLRRALDLTPAMVKARMAGETPDGAKLQVVDWTDGYTTLPLGEEPDFSHWLDGVTPMSWDPELQRLLEVRNGTSFQWRSLVPGAAPSPGPLLPRAPMVLETRHGATLSMTLDGAAALALPGGVVTPLAFGQQGSCPQRRMTPLPGSTASPPVIPFLAGSIGRGGELVATYCNDTLRIYRVDAGMPTLVNEQAVGPGGILSLGSLQVVAGSASCGVAVAYVSVPGFAPGSPPPPPPSTTVVLVRPSGTKVNIGLPSAPQGAPPFPMLQIGLGFSGDGRLFVTRTDGPVSVYRCSDGAALPSIPVPPSSAAPPMPIPSRPALWLDADSFAINDLARRRVIVVNASSNSAQAFDLPWSLDDFEIQRIARFLLPPAAVGMPPRYVRIDRRAQARSVSEDDAPSKVASYVSASLFARSRLLNGGRYMLSGPPMGETTLADLNEGGSSDLAGLVDPVPLAAADGWAAVRGVKAAAGAVTTLGLPAMTLTKVEIYAGSSLMQSVALPELATADRAALATAVSSLAARLHAPFPPEPPGSPMFPAAEVAGLAADPARLGVLYGIRPPLDPVSGSGSVGAHLLCPNPVARTAAGDLKALALLLPDTVLAPLIVTYTTGKPVLSKVPSSSACQAMVLVDGTKPTVVSAEMNGGQRRLRWLRDGQWIDAGPQPSGVSFLMGSALPDGSLLLLQTNAGPDQNYALVRLPVTGGLQTACAACASMPLIKAMQALWQRAQDDPLARPEPAAGAFGPAGTILVDAAGRLLARPDGEETVIESLQTGAEILRVRLSSPLVLRHDLAILDAGEAKLHVHQLAQP